MEIYKENKDIPELQDEECDSSVCSGSASSSGERIIPGSDLQNPNEPLSGTAMTTVAQVSSVSDLETEMRMCDMCKTLRRHYRKIPKKYDRGFWQCMSQLKISVSRQDVLCDFCYTKLKRMEYIDKEIAKLRRERAEIVTFFTSIHSDSLQDDTPSLDDLVRYDTSVEDTSFVDDNPTDHIAFANQVSASSETGTSIPNMIIDCDTPVADGVFIKQEIETDSDDSTAPASPAEDSPTPWGMEAGESSASPSTSKGSLMSSNAGFPLGHSLAIKEEPPEQAEDSSMSDQGDTSDKPHPCQWTVNEDGSLVQQEAEEPLPSEYIPNKSKKARLDDTMSIINPHTSRKTASDMQTFQQYLKEKLEVRPVEEIPPSELDILLGHFFMELKKQDGGEYEPESLTGFQASIMRYLKTHGYEFNLRTDHRFSGHRHIIATKKRLLKQQGKGGRHAKSLPFSDADIQHMYATDVLGTENPEAVLFTLWFHFAIHFGKQSRQELNDMTWGDIELKHTSDNQEYLEFLKMKTTKIHDTKIFADTDDPRCPIKVYLFYKSKRPLDTLSGSSPFFLTPLANWDPSMRTWFSRQKVGKNKLGKFTREVSRKANLTGGSGIIDELKRQCFVKRKLLT